MSWDNKVVWSEGMFLRTHHFQQFDRYVEKLVRNRSFGLRQHGWGIVELALNRELLATGKFALNAARGVMEDGTPFAIPEDVDHPPPLVLPDGTRNCIVYLAIPVRQPGGIEVDRADTEETTARYGMHEFEAADANAFSESIAPIQVAKLRMRYLLETDDRAGYVTLGLARVVEVRADKNIVLDDRYIPPALGCGAAAVLNGFLSEVMGLLHHRGEALAGRVGESGTKGVAEIADFLLLQVVNRFEPVFAHMASQPLIHPETFYMTALELAGELATFTSKTKRPPSFPPYRHDDLQKTFQPVVMEIRQSLSAVIEQTAIPIPLAEPKYGIRVGQIVDKSLLENAAFVLAVRASAPAEAIRRHFPSQVKIGPVEQIRQLVLNALPGVTIRPLPVAPRQIPFHAGVIYFEMDRSSRYWEDLKTSGGIAIHTAGDFPNLQMECWAIREMRG